MDSKELNKIAAAALCAGIAFFAADEIGAVLATVRPPIEPAFAIAVPGAVRAVLPIVDRLRTASAIHGEAYAAVQCSACHSFAAGGPVIVGPDLYGVAGAAVASQTGYDYSEALQRVGGRWTAARLDGWLTRPASFAPGTKMGFGGIADPATRADTIAYLLTLTAAAKPPALAATPAAATAPLAAVAVGRSK